MAQFDIEAVFKVSGLAELNAAFKTVGSSARKLGADFQRFGRDARSFGRNIAIGVTALSVAVAETVGEFTNFEDALINVQKVTDLSEQEIQSLRENIEGLSVELATSQEELLDMAAAAGRLGIEGVENLTNFTETGAKLAVAIEGLDPTEVITALNNLLKVSGEGPENIDNLGSSLVELGNNAGTTEDRILEISREVGRSGALFNLGSAEVLGLSAAFAELQLRPQQARAVLSRFFITVNDAVRTNGAELEKFAEISGQSVEDFTKAFQEDSLSTFFSFSEGLSQLSDRGDLLENVLNETGLASQGSSAAFAQLAKNVDNLQVRVNQSTDAFGENVATQAEFENRTRALSFVIQQGIEVFRNMRIAAGETLKPAITELSLAFQEAINLIRPIFIGAFSDLNETLLEFAKNIRERVENDPESIKQMVQSFIDSLKLFGQALLDILNSLRGLGETILTLSGLFSGASGQTLAFFAALTVLSGGLRLIISTIALVRSSLLFLQSIMIATGITAKGQLAATFIAAMASMLASARTTVAAIISRMAALVASLSISGILNGVAAAFRVFWVAALGPAGLIAAGIAAIGTIIALVVDWERVINLAGQAWDFVIGKIKSAINWVKELFGFSGQSVDVNINENRTTSSDSSGIEAEGTTRRFAQGGHINGPGTPTSDSIVARLSRGEYVVRAASVRKFGVDFMNKINNGIVPTIRGFANGGLVDALEASTSSLRFGGGIASPVAVAGSPARTGRPLNLFLPGGGKVEAFVEEDTADKLQRNLRRSDIAKSSDLPGWFK